MKEKPLPASKAKITEYKVAIIGCGLIAGGYDDDPIDSMVRTHALAYQKNVHTSLFAVVDQDIETARRFADKWGARYCYQSVAEMLEEQKPSIASICTPDAHHAEALEACLKSGSVQGVWCEKPVTTNFDQARTFIKEYQSANKTLLVNYPRPYAPKLASLKTQVLAGDYGSVQKVVAYYTKGIMHNGSHALDLLIGWFGAPISVQVLRAMVDFADRDPTVDALVNLQGVPVYLMGLDEACYSQFEIDIFCSTARVSLTHNGRYIQMQRLHPESGPGGNNYLDENILKVDSGTSHAMSRALETLIASLDAPKSLMQGDHDLCVMEVCEQLANAGRLLLQD